ncbi:hypothetical protein R1flu_014068 [Riccia fluitans]|uniref:Uncharacterized protein n=1 Tax=Riccia fluitans TaxID=41844 RepID=A0ABD1YI68_9MARC
MLARSLQQQARSTFTLEPSSVPSISKVVLWSLLLLLSESMLASGAEQVRAILVAQNQLLFCSGVPLGHNSSFLQGPAYFRSSSH